MGLKAMEAVINSNLSPSPLRHLALMLAWFADDDGGSIRPSVATLKTMIGCQERVVRTGLQQLRDRGVLTVESRQIVDPHSGRMRPVGGRPRAGSNVSTRYRMDFAVLATLPPAEKPRSVRPKKPCSVVQGIFNSALEGEKPCSPTYETLQSTADDPSGSVLIRQSRSAPQSRRATHTANSLPEPPNERLIEAIVIHVAKRVFMSEGVCPGEHLNDAVKWECAQLRVRYDSQAVRKAMDSIAVQVAKGVGRASLELPPHIAADWTPSYHEAVRA